MRERRGAKVGVRLLAAFALALAAAAAHAPSKGADTPRGTAPHPSTSAWHVPYAHVSLGSAGAKRARDVSWAGGVRTAFTGERVVVFVSTSYPDGEALAQHWANAIAGLLHGSELARLTAYVAPLPEVEALCYSRNVLGCYGGNELVTIGEPVDGVSAEEVLAHEYGHHLAANRQNAPWVALDWGTKRWASNVDVCRRVAARTAFPGDEGVFYSLNPGEAFAESYRVLNEVRSGATDFRWGLADPSFRPDEAALAAVETDVKQPWTKSATHAVRARIAGRVWTSSLPTPLDGDLVVTLKTPLGATHALELRSPDGRLLGRGFWSGSGRQTLTYRVCGERRVVLQVRRQAGPRQFTLRIDAPS